ncbi:DEAD/DEAH box helicase family protein [Pseudomonas alliivorans]|nr:DEAD/DEAH box helicase family protein [Pseudomonas alliivorans]
MFKDIPSELPLWPHQRSALAFLINHLRQIPEPCLVRMPTGTGKTGVIACLSLLSASGRTLVLTPWANLRDQMIDALKEGFWKRLGLSAPAGKVVGLLPSSSKSVLGDPQVKVIVCTFSALTELRRTNESLYSELASFVETVVVDECHYEPAIEWGRAVKGLGRPTVLLTATPYRNDLKLFRIKSTQSSIFHYTHEAAETSGIVRKLSFVPLSEVVDVATLCNAFIREWQDKKNNQKLASKDPRAIVCCATAEDIRTAVGVLQNAGLNAIGIHEQFEGSVNTALMKDVPHLNNPAQIWVHQNKLTEGLDDFRFCCLVFMCNVNNDRKLVQQIGRVLRSCVSDTPNLPALIMAPLEYELEERWLAYRDFEKNTSIMDSEHFRRVVEGLLAAQPSVEYFDGRFRKRFRTDILSDNAQVAIAPSVLVRKVQPSFKLEEYIDDCTDSLNLTDAVILGQPNSPCQQSNDFALWVYASVANSRLLEDKSFYEVRLEAHCVVLAGDYLLVSDTTGTFPENLLENHTIELGASDLSGLMDASYRVTNVAVSSAVPFDTVLRASEHRGHDLNIIPASLTDRVQICRAARGASKTGRRYIGLHRGRVREELSERKRRQHSVTLFKNWAKSIGIALSTKSINHPVLQRYMQPCTAPDNPVPTSISVDFAQQSVQVSRSEGPNLLVTKSSIAVQNVGIGAHKTFECEFQFSNADDPTTNVSALLSIEYQRNKGRFWFKSRGATSVHVYELNSTTKRNLADFLNQNQEMLLIGLEGGEMVYQGRNFYAVDYAHAEQALFDKIIRPAVTACSNEKGTKSEVTRAKISGQKAKLFIEGSLFKRIAEGNLPLGFTPDLIICDDLGSECADFVVANFLEKELALIHAKAGSGSGISASAFHDVVAQAMKNLVYLSRNSETPDGAGSWTKGARWNGTDIPRVYQSPPKCPTGKRLWQKLRNEIIDSANARLHVALVTTGCCNLSKLKAAVRDVSKRTAETAQLLHLLDGLIGYARQLGVQVTIFDVPFLAKTMRKGSIAKIKGTKAAVAKIK